MTLILTLQSHSPFRLKNVGNDTDVKITYGGSFTALPDYDFYVDYFEVTGVEHYFIATINDVEHNFIIVPDSDKMVTPSYESSDLRTDVTVSAQGASFPLDTLIEVEHLTSGAEYDKLIKVLGVKDNATFDIKLHSNSIDGYITKLDNGKFGVKIPVPDNFKGKDLIAYYVDANDKVIEYKVTVDKGYAVFETDHFSIYTLAEANADSNTNDNEGNAGSNSNNNEENGDTNIKDTGDNVVLWMCIGFMLMGGVVLCGTGVYGRIIKRRQVSSLKTFTLQNQKIGIKYNKIYKTKR